MPSCNLTVGSSDKNSHSMMSASRKIIKLTDLTPDEQLVLKTTSKLRKLKDDENLMLYLLEELQRLSLSLEKYEIALFPLASGLVGMS